MSDLPHTYWFWRRWLKRKRDKRTRCEICEERRYAHFGSFDGHAYALCDECAIVCRKYERGEIASVVDTV